MHATYLAILVSYAHERAKRYAGVMPVYPQIIRQQVWKHHSNDYYIHEHFYMLLTTQTYRVNHLGVKPRGFPWFSIYNLPDGGQGRPQLS